MALHSDLVFFCVSYTVFHLLSLYTSSFQFTWMKQFLSWKARHSFSHISMHFPHNHGTFSFPFQAEVDVLHLRMQIRISHLQLRTWFLRSTENSVLMKNSTIQWLSWKQLHLETKSLKWIENDRVQMAGGGHLYTWEEWSSMTLRHSAPPSDEEEWKRQSAHPHSLPHDFLFPMKLCADIEVPFCHMLTDTDEIA